MGPGDSKPITHVTLDPGMLIDDAVVDATGLWLSLEGTMSGPGVDTPSNDDHTGSLIHVGQSLYVPPWAPVYTPTYPPFFTDTPSGDIPTETPIDTPTDTPTP